MFQRRGRVRLAGVAAVAATAMLAAGCGSSNNNASTNGSVKGATATLANINGAGANCIFPVETTACYSVTNYEDFQYLLVRPLYMFGGNSNTSISVNYALSPANAPTYSNGGKTVVINLKNWKWSNGESVNAKDLILNLNMIEGEKTNYAGWTPGLLPDNLVSYAATGPQQVTLQLKQAYSSIWFTYNQLAVLTPMPMAWDVSAAGAAAGSGGCTADTAADGWAKCKAVWTFLNTQNKATSTFATNPLWQVVDGPYKLTSYNVAGNYTMVPNPKYSGTPKASVDLKWQSYTTDTAIYTALRTGSLSLGGVPSTDLQPAAHGSFLPPSNPVASAGYALQPGYEFGIGYAYENWGNPVTGPIFKQLYFRQALAYLDDQAGMDTAVGRGYWYPTDSGVPAEPVSQWVSGNMTENSGLGPYPYNPAKAKALLAAHGWKVAGGVLTCESSACGTGIKVGAQAKFGFQYTSGISTQADQTQILKSSLALAGIQLNIEPVTFNTLLAELTPCHGPKCTWDFFNLGGWLFNGPGFEPTGEPLFQTGAPNNSGGYSDPTMDTLINATHTSNSLSAFSAYANYTATQVPYLFLPWVTVTVAVSNHMSNVTQNPLLMFFPEYWTCSSTKC